MSKRNTSSADAGDATRSDEAGSRKRGRPAGSTTQRLPTVDAPASRCPKCGSTAREPYFNVVTHAIDGIDPDTGKPFNRIAFRRTKCSACGQHRTDRTRYME